MIPHDIKLLLIEDDPADAYLFKTSLAKQQCLVNVVWEQRLDDGLARLKCEEFDIVVTDLSLTDSSGQQTIDEIRSLVDATPIIVMSGLDDADVASKLLESGAQDYFVKGEFSGLGLIKAIRHSIQRHENHIRTLRLLADVEEKSVQLDRSNKKLAKLYAQAHRFVDNVSHEFRTPLTVVKEYVSLVREGYAGDVNDEQVRLLNIAEDRADDLNTMVDDMLDVSKLEAGMLGAWRKNCAASDIIDHVQHSLQRKADVKRVTLQWEIDQEIPQLYCDAEKAGRALTNLAVNAIKFCRDPGVVKISFKSDPDSRDLRISVTDNGPGIDSDELGTVFGRFKQLASNARGSTNGFGLGLSIASELVALNFGQLNVTSQPDIGSVFSFTVPLADPLEVMNRYVKVLQQTDLSDEQTPDVSIIRIACGNDAEAKHMDDLDSFFNYCLRNNDLLFRAAQNCWAIVLPVSRTGVDGYISRITKELNSANRNRPFGPLPQPSMRLVGTWPVAAETTAITKQLHDLLGLQRRAPEKSGRVVPKPQSQAVERSVVRAIC